MNRARFRYLPDIKGHPLCSISSLQGAQDLALSVQLNLLQTKKPRVEFTIETVYKNLPMLETSISSSRFHMFIETEFLGLRTVSKPVDDVCTREA